jgi:hypothetical protein
MKKFLTAVAMALLLVGCTREAVDLSGINEKLAELDNRVSALEGAIASIQSAIGDGVFVQKVEQYADPETGKTIGVTITYTSGKVVYFEISPKADYAGPVLGVIRSGSGSLVWAVDGIAIKDAEGNEVPVNKTPVFTIDEDGYLWVSIDGGDPVKLGQVKSEGASLVDGIFKDIKVEQDKVVLVLSDDSIVNIPFAEAFKLVIEGTEFLNDGGKAITIPYSVTAKTANTVVDVTGYDPTYFYVQVTDENIIITPLMSWVSSKMLIYADSKVGLTSMVSIEISPECARVIDPRVEGDVYANYVVESEGGTIEMHVVSNVEIEAKVLDDCDWITIVSTKSKTYTITAAIAENTGMARFGYVAIYKKGTDKQLQTIDIYQAKTSAVTNLSKNGTANSYIITKPGDFKFKAVKGNSAESVGTVAKAEILWETENTTTAPEANSVIAAVGVDGEFITFSTPDNLMPGNALIAAKDASDKVLWSWHIWIPETEIVTSTFGGIVKNAMMDRNLGALVATDAKEVDGRSIGMLYQWGRKDPFPGAASVSSSDPIAVQGSVSLSSDKTNFTVAETIENPTVYVKTGGDSNKTWMTDEEKSTAFWGKEKTMYDPCPPGYITPTRDKEEMIWGKTATFVVDEASKLIKIGASAEATEVAVFPIAGYLDQGSYSNVGSRMYLWSSYASSSEKNIAYQFYVKGTSISVEEQRMSRGGNIRCVVDPNAPQPDPTVDLSEKGSANSYIVSAAGDYKFKAVKGNSKESVGTIAAVELVWETNNTATAPEAANTIIAKVGVDDGYITFSTPATLAHGNALIAAKDADGKILWSWHIWIPKTAIDKVDAGFAGTNKILDRNLGALIATPTTEKALESEGLYYQWGRKDPLLGSKITAFPATAVKQSVSEQTTIAVATENPTIYYYNEGKDWLTTPDATLWDNEGTKTMYDPCPVGYKVPAYDATLDMWNKVDNDTFPTLWTYDETNGYVKFTTGTATFPLCGYINGGSQSISGYGKRSLVWSSTAKSETHGSGMFIRENKYYSDGNHKACGASVRCIAE